MGPKSNGTRPSRGEVTSEDELVSQLEGVLEELEDKPQNVTLLRKQASLLRALSLTQELLQCASRLSALVMLSEGGFWHIVCTLSEHGRRMAVIS